jgi:hypothetical protein
MLTLLCTSDILQFVVIGLISDFGMGKLMILFIYVNYVNFRATIKFLFNLLDNNSIGRITERNTITRYTTFILGNPHGGENPAKTSLI